MTVEELRADLDEAARTLDSATRILPTATKWVTLAQKAMQHDAIANIVVFVLSKIERGESIDGNDFVMAANYHGYYGPWKTAEEKIAGTGDGK